jgi:hypothetical protein
LQTRRAGTGFGCGRDDDIEAAAGETRLAQLKAMIEKLPRKDMREG